MLVSETIAEHLVAPAGSGVAGQKKKAGEILADCPPLQSAQEWGNLG